MSSVGRRNGNKLPSIKAGRGNDLDNFIPSISSKLGKLARVLKGRRTLRKEAKITRITCANIQFIQQTQDIFVQIDATHSFHCCFQRKKIV